MLARLLSLVIHFRLLGTSFLVAQQISGVDHFQDGQNIRIVYQLQSIGPVQIKVEVSTNGGKSFSTPLQKVSGDVGKVTSSGEKEILWRVLEEVPELVGEGIVFKVLIFGGEWRSGMVHCNGIPTEIIEVKNPVTGRIWMDRNLGATQAATSLSDLTAYGDLYQWGRFGDGHQCRNSTTTSNLSISNDIGHGKFILSNSSSNWDWRITQNNNLWQGINGINNPCPIGFRLPTESEWEAERESWNNGISKESNTSLINLPLGGSRSRNDGWLNGVSSKGSYWSATVYGSSARSFVLQNRDAKMENESRTNGLSVRCIFD